MRSDFQVFSTDCFHPPVATEQIVVIEESEIELLSINLMSFSFYSLDVFIARCYQFVPVQACFLPVFTSISLLIVYSVLCKIEKNKTSMTSDSSKEPQHCVRRN